VNAFILGQRKLGTNVTVKTIVEHFEAKPYGWPLPAVLSAIARLFAHAQVTLSINSQPLVRTEITEALRNANKRPTTVVTEQRQFDPAKVQAVRRFAQDFFNEGTLPTDPMELAAIVREKLASEQRELESLRQNASQYPFITVLDEPIGLLAQVVGHDVEWYLDELTGHTDDLLDAKQNGIDPIQTFLKGTQRAIYDDAAKLLAANQANLPYLPNGEAQAVKDLLDDPKTFRGAGMNRLKDAAARLRAAIDQAVLDARAQATAEIEGRWQGIEASAAWQETTDTARAQAQAVRDRATSSASTSSSIPVIRQIAAEFDEQGYTAVLNTIEAGRAAVTSGEGTPPTPAPVIVSIRSLPKPKAGAVLSSDADVDEYVAELRGILRQAISEGKRVSL